MIKFILNFNCKKNYQKLRNLTRGGIKKHRLIRNKGSKQNKNYFQILYRYNLINLLGLVIGMYINYFKNKNSYLLIQYSNNSYSYYKNIYGIMLGDYIKTLSTSPLYITNFYLGYIICIKNLSKLMIISNISSNIQMKPIYSKASGTFATILEYNLDLNTVLIQLATKQNKIINSHIFVTVGRNSNVYIKYQVKGKAGVNRILGKHPTSRGVAMNPIDHPHGGRTKTNKPEVSLWGNIAKHNH